MNLTDVRTSIYNVGSQISGSFGFFFDEAPQNHSTYPFIVYHLVDDTFNRLDTSLGVDDILIQFNIYDRKISLNGKRITSVNIEDVTNELITKFDNEYNITNKLDFKRTTTIPATSVDDGQYWQIVVRYSLRVIGFLLLNLQYYFNIYNPGNV